MRTGLYLVGSLLWCLVDSQTVPYVSFDNMNLPNHGYVDFSLVGDAEDGSDSVQCHTDLTSCCTSGIANSADRPDWYFPDGFQVGFEADDDDIYQRRGAQRHDLRRRNNALSPSGIYYCEIPIDDGDDFMRERVYVGIYASGGGITIPDGVTFTLISDDEFTLTCISTGGPATTITWTRDSQTAVGTTNTVLNDAEIARYTHTLTVTGRLTGEYACSVSNTKPSDDSSNYTVQVALAPTDVTAVQTGPKSILVSWRPSSDATGYRIDYTDGSRSGSVTVDGGSMNEQSVTDLNNGGTYTISIVATAGTSLPSESVNADMMVSLVPARPSINTNPSTTATSISLSWSVADSVVTSSVVSFQGDNISGECPDVVGGTPVSGSSTSTTISGLQEGSRYFITVTVFNDAGSSEESSIVTVMTEEAAPSAAPTSVSATSTSTTITVQWGPVECIHRNGVITGYSVQYWAQGQSTKTMSVAGDSSGGSYEITDLQSSTTYSIRVAAISGAGHVGDYSSTITEVTSGILLVSVDSSSTTSLTISWTLGDGVTATSYIISYFNTDTDCFTDSDVITTSEMTRVLTGLEEGTEYSITVTATLTGVSDSLTATTITVAPSAAPSSVSATSTSSSITVQWEMVPCIHRNGNITGYSVQYTGGGSIDSTPVPGGSVMEATISGLVPSTTYSIQVAAVNSAGTGDYSDHVIIETHSQSSDDTRGAQTDTAAVIGGVVAIVLILSVSLTVIVIVVLVLRSRRGQYTTGPRKRETMPPGATNTMELSKFSGEPTYVDPGAIPTSSNEAYHTVSQTGGTTTDYEAVSDPHTVPPSTSHSSQPPTAGDYEQV